MDTKFSHKKRNIWPGAMLAGLLVLGSCQKEKDIFVPFGKTVDALRELMTGLTTGPANTARLDFDGTSSQILLTTPRGIQILMTDANGLFSDASGNPVSASPAQKITLEATDVFEKPEITGLGTVTQQDFGQPLETMGMVKLEAFLGNKPLKLLADKTFQVRVPVGTAGFQHGVFVYEGGWSPSATDIKFRWSQADDIEAPAHQPIPDGITYYQLEAKKLGWIASNRLLPNPTTPIRVKLGGEFSLTNTLAFLVLNEKKSVFPLKYDLTGNLFLNEKAPTGQTGKLVFAAKIGEQLFLATKDITTDSDQVLDLSQEMRPTTEAVLKTALEELK